MRTLRDLASEMDPFVELVTVGGIPVEMLPDIPLRDLYLAMLGTGAILTRRNPRGWGYVEAGLKCESLGHLWTEHVILIGIAIRAHRRVRDAFAFDRRFHLSWVEERHEPDPDVATFCATAPIREFRRYAGNANCVDFHQDVRGAIRRIASILSAFEGVE